ncbi:NADPH:quinone oxidoreductase-like [Vicia villosa]|uniref:NADPH:quinone oxidoreductase-like n=1 Tax=Vicia villosa TaxID=3911 RepID=UPI00273AD14F|nr:NADPH:quinone oxidoreductase-like [Vicia villosa]
MAAAIKIVALSGSIRKASTNTGLIRAAIELSKSVVEGVEIENVDISNLPLVNTDLEKEGTYPAEIEAFRQKIVAADAFLFASPEYNYSLSAPLKNAIDWASRPPNVWAGKPAAIVSVGGGHGGAKSHYHLRQVGVFLDIHFINKPEFFLNAFQPPAKFNSDGDLIDEGAKNNLKAVLLSLKEFTLKLQGKN